MKKMLMVACMMFIATAMFAQQGTTSLGIQGSYSLHKDYKNLGLGVKGQYEFVNNVRAELAFNYYFKKDYTTMWDLAATVHYLIPAGPLTIYPLAGIALVNAKVKTGDINYKDENISIHMDGIDESSTKVGANLGAGLEVPVAEHFKLNAEFRYQIVSNFNRPIISIGAAYVF